MLLFAAALSVSSAQQHVSAAAFAAAALGAAAAASSVAASTGQPDIRARCSSWHLKGDRRHLSICGEKQMRRQGDPFCLLYYFVSLIASLIVFVCLSLP